MDGNDDLNNDLGENTMSYVVMFSLRDCAPFVRLNITTSNIRSNLFCIKKYVETFTKFSP